MIRRGLAVAICAAGWATAPFADPAVPEPAGYHGEPYRAPVPDGLTGATKLDAATTADWQGKGAVLIDVLPAVRRPKGLPDGTLWRPPRHDSLPGAVWLADVGYQALALADEARFAAALDRLSQGDKAAPLVFFCKADCWMSWNAAKRALALGYRRVGWFSGGTDAWVADGRALAPLMPAD